MSLFGWGCRLPPRSWCFMAFAMLLFAGSSTGCRRTATPTKTTTRTETKSEDDALETAREALIKKADLAACKGAVQQLNLYLSRRPEQKPRLLDDNERKLLDSDYQLQPDEIAEVNSTAFTLLDAHHLDQCILLRDAVRSLELEGSPPLEQATAGFAWVNRQVRLAEGAGEPSPPQFVLHRGSGTGLERSLVFLSLLDQIGLDGCMVVFPADAEGEKGYRWNIGVLIDKDVFLFDSRIGMPIPGPLGQGVATLAQARSDANVFGQLTIANSQHPYDITHAQAGKAEILLTGSLSALAPRMRFLQDVLSSTSKIRLGIDSAARLDKFRSALQGQNIKIGIWNRSVDASPPTTLLRNFLAPEEGGIDSLHPYSVRSLIGFAAQDDGTPLPLFRKKFFEYQLAPWTELPPSIRQLPWTVPIGRLPREFFTQLFVGFYMSPRMPRDLIVHGRYDEAIQWLTENQDRLEREKKALRVEAQIQAQIAEWFAAARQAQADYLAAQSRAAGGDSSALAALKAAEANLTDMWRQGEKPLSFLLHEAMNVPMGSENAYFLAICKHEQAERLDARLRRNGVKPTAAEEAMVRDAWRNAAGLWETYENTYDFMPFSAAARTLHARALLALDDPTSARSLLENTSGRLSNLEKTARIYQISRLKQ